MKIAIPAAAALALATAGCYYGGDAAITFSWSLSRNGTPLTCEAAGAATLDLVASQRGFDRVYHEVIPCDLLGVTFDGFRPGMYDVAINLVDANGNALNEPFALPVAMYGDQLTDLGNLEFAFDSGRFAASWVITINGADATCEDVGATIFQITSRLGGQEYVDTFECGRMAALTEDLPPGSLVVGIALLDEDGATLNAAPFVQEVTLGAGETKNLGEFEFAFNYRKAFFRAHMGTAATLGGNCQSTDPDGGAGVVQQEIRVTRPGSAQCVAYDVGGLLDESGEAKTTPTCSPYGCQNESLQQHLANLQSGDYVIQVLGYKAGSNGSKNVCYVSSGIPFTMGTSDIDLGTITALPDDSANPGRCN